MLLSIVTHLAVQFFVVENVITFIHGQKVHELMTEDEIVDTFHTTPDSVPDYHIVELSHTINKRTPTDRAEMHVLANGYTVKHYLEENKALFDVKTTLVYTTDKNGNGPVIYNPEKDMVKAAIALYQSTTSAVVAHSSRSSREIYFYGTIGDMYIRPLPVRLQRATDNGYKHPERGNASWSKPSKHILFPRSLSTSNNLTEALMKELEPGNLSLLNEMRNYRIARAPRKQKLERKDYVYPSIVLTSDFNDERASPMKTGYSDSINHRRAEAVASRVLYLLAFINQVDLRFRSLEEPRVKFHIRALVIATSYASTPYIHDYIEPDNSLHLGKILRHMKEYYYGNVPPAIGQSRKHIVVTLTNQRIESTCELTRTYVVNNRLCQDESGPSIHIVYDNKAFSGIISTTNNLGYTLGAEHDDDSREPGCREKDGFIMGTNKQNEDRNYLRWSICSLKEMNRFLRLPKTTCADHMPKITPGKPSFYSLLPGKHVFAADQCRQYGYSGVCRNNPQRCRSLKCYTTGINPVNSAIMKIVKVANLPAAVEGTSCGIGKICLGGECVYDPQPNNLAWDSHNREIMIPWKLEKHNPECPLIQ